MVAREALSMSFEDADATGLEEDARLTAMWLWTLSTSANGGNGVSSAAGEGDEEEKSVPKAGAALGSRSSSTRRARSAQGLGAHMRGIWVAWS